MAYVQQVLHNSEMIYGRPQYLTRKVKAFKMFQICLDVSAVKNFVLMHFGLFRQ